MNELITCPRCRSGFELSEAIAGRLRAELTDELSADVRAREERLAQREGATGVRGGDIEGLAGRALPHAESFALPEAEGARRLPADPGRDDGAGGTTGRLARNGDDGLADRNGRAGRRPEVARSRGLDSEPEGDADVAAHRIVDCLRRSPRPLGRGESLRRAAVDSRQWAATIDRLVSSGHVVRVGESRGARYQLP